MPAWLENHSLLIIVLGGGLLLLQGYLDGGLVGLAKRAIAKWKGGAAAQDRHEQHKQDAEAVCGVMCEIERLVEKHPAAAAAGEQVIEVLSQEFLPVIFSRAPRAPANEAHSAESDHAGEGRA